MMSLITLPNIFVHSLKNHRDVKSGTLRTMQVALLFTSICKGEKKIGAELTW